ncbi:hypothetical protein SARC_07782, partial [Sphaeroforma arctica JP610]
GPYANSTDRMADNWVLAANRLLMSTSCFMIYIMIVGLSICQVIWTLVDPSPDTIVFWFIEAIIIGSLLAEMCLKYLAMGSKKYFLSWSNRFDIVVIILMIVSLGLYVHTLGSVNKDEAFIEEDFGLAVLIVRNLAQILRIFMLLKNSQKADPSQAVDFTTLREPVTHDAMPLTLDDEINGFTENSSSYDIYDRD